MCGLHWPDGMDSSQRGGPWSKFFKAGWVRKCGATIRQSSADDSVAPEGLTSFSQQRTLSVADLDITTNVKTRFLLLAEFRLRYGSTSSYEAFRSLSSVSSIAGSAWQTAVDKVQSAALGELFLTGDAWIRPVGDSGILISGDSKMQRKAGKLYLLNFRNADERHDWEYALSFFLVRAVPAERYERLLLSGWIAAFPNLSNRMDKMRSRKMTVMGRGAPRSEPAGIMRKTASMSAAALKKAAKRSDLVADASVVTKLRSSSSSPTGTKAHNSDDDDDKREGALFGELVSDDSSAASDSSSSSVSDVDDANPLSPALSPPASPTMKSTHSHKRKNQIANLLAAVAIPSAPLLASDLSIADPFSTTKKHVSSAADPSTLIQFTLDAINGDGMPFVLRCQRPSHIYQNAVIDRPQPSYLRVEWCRNSSTLQAVPLLRETPSFGLASRFALRSFANSGSAGVIAPRVVWVEAPGWQLYFKPHKGSQRRGGSLSGTELSLVPIIETTTLPTPGIIETDDDPHSLRAGARRGSQYFGAPPSRRFKAVSWEGSTSSPLPHESANGASFSFLLQASGSAIGDASGDTTCVACFSMTGSVVVVSENQEDATTGDAKNFLTPLEIVPVAADGEIEQTIQHPTPAMRQRALYRAANKSLALSFLQENLVEPVRVVIVGAAGSGKTTIAEWLRKYSVSGDASLGKPLPEPAVSGAVFPSDVSVGSVNESVISGGEAQTRFLETLHHQVAAVNCSGIAVPFVVTDVPASSNETLMSTQCGGADIVICMFDLSDEHSLYFIEQRLRLICGATMSAGGNGSARSNRFPRTRFILCGTRSDSLRIAVDGYRLEAFMNATVPFTGPVETSWNSHVLQEPTGHKQQELFVNHSFDDSAQSIASQFDNASRPFAVFGSVWRTWRLPTAVGPITDEGKRRAEWELLHNATLTDSFVLSPKLRHMAAQGISLRKPQPDSSVLISSGISEDYPSTPKARLETDSNDEDDGGGDETVPRLLMSHMAAILEEIHFVRIGKSLGWSDGMLLRFATAAAKLSLGVSSPKSENDGDFGRADSYHDKATEVATLLQLMGLPDALQFDAAQEVMHRAFRREVRTQLPPIDVSMNSTRHKGFTPSPRRRIEVQELLLSTSVTLNTSVVAPATQGLKWANSNSFRKQRVAPSWRDLLGVTVPEWGSPWLVLRWICTGWSLGDIRCEWLLSRLKGLVGSSDIVDSGASGGMSEEKLGDVSKVQFRFPFSISSIEDDASVELIRSQPQGTATAWTNENIERMLGAPRPISANHESVNVPALQRRTLSAAEGAMPVSHDESGIVADYCSVPITDATAAHRASAGRLFHPLDLWFWGASVTPPSSAPPVSIRNSALWLYRIHSSVQQHLSSPVPNHASQQMLMHMFCLCGMTISREHSGHLLRWADVNHDQLTDVGDFLRWYCLLVAGAPAVTLAVPKNGMQRPVAPTSNTSGASSGFSPQLNLSRYLVLFSGVWSVRTLQKIPLMSDLSTAMASGMHSDEAHAVASFASSCRLPVSTVVQLLGAKAPSALQAPVNDGLLQTPLGTAGDLNAAKSGSNASSFTRIFNALKGSSVCNLCHSVFRPFFRAPVVCQECNKQYCSNCCSAIVVLDDVNRTVKRFLCKDCRRAHSTFLNDHADDHASAHSTADNNTKNESQPSAVTPFTVKGNVVWEDNAQTTCSICTLTFTMLRRRHHCRVCGSLVCANCSPHLKEVSGYSTLQRVCKSCWFSREAVLLQQANDEKRGRSAQLETASVRRVMSSTFDMVTSDDFVDISDVASVDVSSPNTETASGKQRSTSLMSVAFSADKKPTKSHTASEPDGIAKDDAMKRRKWQAWASMKSEVSFELSWREIYTEEQERLHLTTARNSLLEQARLTKMLQGTAAGRAALAAERGPQWSYTVMQPGYFAVHDGELELRLDRSLMEELGPDVEAH